MSDFDGVDRRQYLPEPWHMSKSISIVNILSIVGMFFAGAVGYSNFNQKVSDTVKETEFNRVLIVQTQEAQKNDKREIKTVVDQINQKLDRLIERQLKGGSGQ